MLCSGRTHAHIHSLPPHLTPELAPDSHPLLHPTSQTLSVRPFPSTPRSFLINLLLLFARTTSALPASTLEDHSLFTSSPTGCSGLRTIKEPDDIYTFSATHPRHRSLPPLHHLHPGRSGESRRSSILDARTTALTIQYRPSCRSPMMRSSVA